MTIPIGIRGIRSVVGDRAEATTRAAHLASDERVHFPAGESVGGGGEPQHACAANRSRAVGGARRKPEQHAQLHTSHPIPARTHSLFHTHVFFNPTSKQSTYAVRQADRAL